MTDYDHADDVLRSGHTGDVIETTIDLGDQSIPIKTKIPTTDDLEQLSEETDSEIDLYRAAVDEYVIEPDTPAGEIPRNTLNLLWFKLAAIWNGTEDLQGALEELQMGNPHQM